MQQAPEYSDEFIECLRFVLKWEGSKFVHHPLDRGGPTRYGITQAVYDKWRKAKKQPPRSVQLITLEEVADIYWHRYWLPAGCDWLPHLPLKLFTFDTAVNMGVGRAKQFLTKALQHQGAVIRSGTHWQADVKATLKKMRKEQIKELVAWLLDHREQFYHKIVAARPEQRVFLKGWLNRVADLRRRINQLWLPPPAEGR